MPFRLNRLNRCRLILAIAGARLTASASRLLRRGYGSALPGRVAARLYPGTLADLAVQPRLGTAMITGTNGKTTITKLLAAILEQAGHPVLFNKGGANLVSGITTAFALNASWTGRITCDFALMETDEATMPKAAPAIKPLLMMANDFFRDQLDRFGELDSSVESLRKALPFLQTGGTLVLNADDPLCVHAGRGQHRRLIYFGLSAPPEAAGTCEAADAVFCPVCHERFAYERRSYSHLGVWRCTACDFQRPEPTVYAENIHLRGMRGATFDLVAPEGRLHLDIVLPGLYSVYNVLGATAAALALGAPLSAVPPALAATAGSFGRAEFFDLHGQEACLLLVKNPTGFNQVLQTLTADDEPKTLLFAINDRLADGRDISWLWDVNLEQLWEHADIARQVVVTGDRGEEMAVRLKYSGPDDLNPEVVKPPAAAVSTALAAAGPGRTVYVLATYTAMLELWEVLKGLENKDYAAARADRTPGR